MTAVVEEALMARSALLVFILLVTSSAARSIGAGGTAEQAFPTPPPLPPERPVGVTRYGTSVTDPYRYFEKMNDPV